MSARPEGEPLTEPEAEPETESESEAHPEAEDGAASAVEMVVPMAVLIVLFLIALVIVAAVSKFINKKYKHSFTNKPTKIFTSLPKVHPDDESYSVTQQKYHQPFFTEQDESIIDQLCQFQNRLKQLIIMSLPTLLSLAFCPATLFLYNPMVEFFWPKDVFPVLPNVNDVIACFLTPAGLVYAIAFGFAFQEALSKQADLTCKIGKVLNIVQQMIVLIRLIHEHRIKDKLMLLRHVKIMVVQCLTSIMDEGKSGRKFTEKENLLTLMKTLRTCTTDLAATKDDTDARTIEQIHTLVMEYDTLTSEMTCSLTHKINFVQWIFLECVGFFAFFGVLLIQAHSYKLQLILCILTVLSISVFCLILSDLDTPYHGAFRVDLSVFIQLLSYMDNIHQTIIAGGVAIVNVEK